MFESITWTNNVAFVIYSKSNSICSQVGGIFIMQLWVFAALFLTNSIPLLLLKWSWWASVCIHNIIFEYIVVKNEGLALLLVEKLRFNAKTLNLFQFNQSFFFLILTSILVVQKVREKWRTWRVQRVLYWEGFCLDLGLNNKTFYQHSTVCAGWKNNILQWFGKEIFQLCFRVSSKI